MWITSTPLKLYEDEFRISDVPVTADLIQLQTVRRTEEAELWFLDDLGPDLPSEFCSWSTCCVGSFSSTVMAHLKHLSEANKTWFWTGLTCRISQLFLMPSSVQRAMTCSGLLHPEPSSSRLRTFWPTVAVSRDGAVERAERSSDTAWACMEDERPESDVGPHSDLRLSSAQHLNRFLQIKELKSSSHEQISQGLLEHLIWISLLSLHPCGHKHPRNTSSWLVLVGNIPNAAHQTSPECSRRSSCPSSPRSTGRSLRSDLTYSTCLSYLLHLIGLMTGSCSTATCLLHSGAPRKLKLSLVGHTVVLHVNMRSIRWVTDERSHVFDFYWQFYRMSWFE